MNRDEAIAVVFIVTILLVGKWLFGGRNCWGCGGSGVSSDGYLACPKCNGRGRQ